MNGPPICADCGTAKQWVAPGVSRTTGQPFDGFWGCPNRKNHAPAPQGTPQVPQAARTAPNGGGRGWQPRSPEERASIEVQAVIKAVCEVAAGPVGDKLLEREGAEAVVITEWIITASRRILREVVYPVTGAPIPEGLANPRSGWAARTNPPQRHPNEPAYNPDDVAAPPWGEDR